VSALLEQLDDDATDSGIVLDDEGLHLWERRIEWGAESLQER
jgi:hypothetical protein